MNHQAVLASRCAATQPIASAKSTAGMMSQLTTPVALPRVIHHPTATAKVLTQKKVVNVAHQANCLAPTPRV